jgi:hypothetical protein
MKIKNINSTGRSSVFTGAFCLILLLSAGCKKFLQIPLPTDKISGTSAYTNDKSGAASINYILGNLTILGNFDGANGIGYLTGLYSDEIKNYSLKFDPTRFYQNAIAVNNTNKVWVDFYNHIYNCNLAIEGLKNTTSVLPNRNQWIGEALVLRAYLYFNLVNLYGDVPLAITSDYRINNTLSRSPKADVYKQMISDLIEAQSLLSAEYRNASSSLTTERIRPNKLTATALLARVYLYTENWAKAEEQASILINDKADFALPTLDQAFLSASKETIWAFAVESTSAEKHNRDLTLYSFNVPAVIPPGETLSKYSSAIMSNSLFSAFEPGDQRLVKWSYTSSNSVVAPAVADVYHLFSKYKSTVNRVEDIVLFRLAEQYLIRAEARAKQNKLTGIGGAKEDLDAVRIRAGLAGTTANTNTDMLAAIAKERRTELFTEMGHRFFDLKRTGEINTVMAIEAPVKGGTWNAQKQIWPIPSSEIFANPNLTQAPGY